MKKYADIYKALADETRLTIMALLFRQGELCVCNVETILKISQSKASRHLRYLKNVGLIEDRREGAWVYYRISENVETESGKLLEVNRDFISSLLGGDVETRLSNFMKNSESCGSSCDEKQKVRILRGKNGNN